MSQVTTPVRTHPDRCPGLFRPWQAADGALVRLRLVGGRIGPAALSALSEVAQRYGDGELHLTSRANVQLRALPAAEGVVRDDVVAAVEATGLVPSRSHERVRNVLVSPQTGLAEGRADLRPTARRLDRLLCGDPALAGIPGRFLFVLDDGRGDLADRPADLGLVALDATTAQLRVGNGWGSRVALTSAPDRLAAMARTFLRIRGGGVGAPWHVDELPAPLAAPVEPHPGALVRTPPLPYGAVPGGTHVQAPAGVLDAAAVAELVASAEGRELVVTPWRGVLVPAEDATR
jgi:precorrin-3B synthase